jgi:uncharacterized protein YdcH (DUF465 family)
VCLYGLAVSSYDSAWPLQNQQKENRLMEKSTQEELKAHLMETEPEFRRLADEHAAYKRQLDAIESKGHLTLDDEAEENRLKKLKLKLKDQMIEFMARYSPRQVA